MSSHMTRFRATLETEIPIVGNMKAWYRQGSTIEPISDEFAEYALNLVVTNIVLLVGIYMRGIRVKLE